MSTQHDFVDLSALPLPEFLERRGDEEVYLAGHRVTLENLCSFYNEGYSADMLRERFPTLPLVLVHKVIVFYLEHREAVDRYLAECQAVRDHDYERWREAPRAAPDAAELRRRLENGATR